MSDVPGARFCKVDLHVHTPASSDFKDKETTPQAILARALEAGLDAFAVTDHNTPLWLERMLLAARDSGLVVFPGLEINAQGGHLLAIFDPSTPLAAIETALIEAGIPKQRWGDTEAIGRDFQSALRAVRDNGGLTIAAHADGPKGFLTAIQQGALKIELYQDPALSAMELLSQDRRSDYTAGRIGGYPRPMPCLQGSDAHSLAEIGSKYTLIRMHRVCVEGLRQAFADHDLRLRFAQDDVPAPYPYIRRLNVDQGFLAGTDILFNPSLNCLVGGAGSGKSTVIEFIRFALDQVSPVDDIAEDAKGKLRDLAGLGATIRLTLALESGTLLEVARTFDEDTNPISVIDKASGEELEATDIKVLFPIHAYSQGEVVNISRNPLAQLDLIDSHIDISGYQSELDAAYQELSQQEDGLARLTAVIRDKDDIDKQLANTNAQANLLTAELESLQQAQKSEVVTSHQYWIAEEAYFRDILDAFAETRRSIEDGIAAIELPLLHVPTPPEPTPNADILTGCRDSIGTLQQDIDSASRRIVDALAAIEKKVRSAHTDWEKAFKRHNSQYEELRVGEKASRIAQINTRLGAFRKNIQALRAKGKAIEAAERTFNRLLSDRARILNTIGDRKARIFALRERKARQFVRQIGNTIALRLVPDGNREEFEELLAQILRGTRAQRSVAQRLAQSHLPAQLAALLSERNGAAIDSASGVGKKWVETLSDAVGAQPEFLYRIEACPMEDLLDISFRVAEGEYRPIHKLSTGQKATVIVLLTMVEGNNPIIFDQPEDALYTPFIYTDVVKALRREKDERQFVLATHNPNIAVGGDADLGIVLEGTSSQALIKSAGGLDDHDTQSLLLWHLEGGKQALQFRHDKFGLR